MTRILFSLFLLSLTANLTAQELKYGFKVGLNFNSIDGDGEMDDAGTVIEEYTGNTGFHVGATLTWEATELMGVRGELLYSQKGSRRGFDGQSYYIFNTNADKKIVTSGTRDQQINVTTSYIDIPVMGYVKPVEWLEVYAGASVGVLVGASGFGGVTYSGTAPNGSPISEFVHDLDANYVSDDPGEARFSDPPTTITIGNEKAILPSAGGAYFEFEEDKGNLFNVIDVGLVGGVSFYLNKGFYVSGRLNYGLTDITKSEADVSLVKLDNGQFISRDDVDKNFSIQASVGFSF